jgi:outer membrane protein
MLFTKTLHQKYRVMKKYNFILICFLSIVIFPFLSNAQSMLSLDQALSIGLKNNYQIYIDSNNVKASSINNSLGNAGFLPQAALTGSAIYQGENIEQKYSTGSEVNRNNISTNTELAEAELTWTIFDGGHAYATAKLLRFEEAQERDISKVDVQNLISEIINDYYNVVQQKKLVQQIDSSLKYYNVQLQTTQSLQANGKGTRQQVLQAQIDQNTEQAAYYNQLNGLLDAKTALNQLLIRSGDADFDVADSIPVSLNAKIDTSDQFLTQHNPSLLESYHNIDIQQSILRQNQANRFPKLSFNGGYEYSNTATQAGLVLKNQFYGWNAGLTLSFNLFNGFVQNDLVQVSKLNVQNAHLEYQLLSIQTHAELSTAYHKYNLSMQQVTLQYQNLQLARENLQIAIEEYKLNAITQVDLQQAQNSYDIAGASYITSLYNTKNAETNLLLLSGALAQ